jgi:hypothetical protein
MSSQYNTYLYLSILLHHVTYNVTVSVSVQHNGIYYLFSFSLSQHVSALIVHLQVMITMLTCHTVLIFILATLFSFVTHTRIVYIKSFVYNFILKNVIKISFHKLFRL